MKKYEVAVIGGGFAGVAAAVAAARQGATVLLVTKDNCLGGAASNGLVNPFMPYKTTINGVKTALSQGIFKEIHTVLEQRGAMHNEDFDKETLKIVLNELVLSNGVDLLFHAYIFAANKEGEKVKSVSLATKSGVIELEADYFIDCTGDAQLAYLSGCPVRLGREQDNLCQPMTLCFRVGNADVDAFYSSIQKVQAEYKRWQSEGKITNPRENILVFKTPNKGVLHFNTTRVVKKNPTDPFDVTEAEIIARRQVFELWEFLKQTADGLEKAFIASTAAEIGVRESRMIEGEHTLTEKECRDCTKFPDAIAACNYDIDIHNPEGSGTSHYYFPDGEYYTIPYRSLIPKGASNMLVAGRCISSDHGAQASYRIMPVVCCLGEAAGVAISLAARDKVGVRDIDSAELRAKLKQNGAFIG